MSEDTTLVKGLRLFIQQHPLSEISAYEHFHLQNKDQKDYIQNTLNDLYKEQSSNNCSAFIIKAEYIAYLVAFQPDYAQKFLHVRQMYERYCYVERGNNQEYQKQFSILGLKLKTIPPVKQLIQQIELGLIKIGCNKDIQNIQLKMKSLEWILDYEKNKKQISQLQPNLSSQLIRHLFTFICKEYRQDRQDRQYIYQFVMKLKIKLLIGVILFLGNKFKDYQKDGKLQKFVSQCMQKINNQETKSQIFLLLSLIIQNFKKSINNYQILPFIKHNKNFFYKMQYLLMVRLFFKCVSEKPTKDFNLQILQRCFKSQYDELKLKPQQVYRIKKTITEIIMLISQQTKFDLTKDIQKLINKTSDNIKKKIYLMSLVRIYQQKWDTQQYHPYRLTMKSFFNDENLFAESDKFLAGFCTEYIQIQTDNKKFLQDLIIIRINILNNFSFFQQQGRINGLRINLFKFMTLNIFPQECLEIIQITYQLQLPQKIKICFSDIFSYQPKLYFSTEEVVVLFKNILLKFLSKVELLQLKETLLCQKLVDVMTCKKTSQNFSLAYFQHFSNLISITIPKNIDCYQNQIGNIIRKLFQWLKNNQNFSIMKLYISIMNRTIGMSLFDELYKEQGNIIYNIINGTPILLKLNNSFMIPVLIIKKIQFTRQNIEAMWKQLKSSNIIRFDFVYHILNLFKNLSGRLTDEQLKDYCDFQIPQIIKFINQLTGKLSKKDFAKYMLRIIEVNQAYHLFLYETLQLYLNTNGGRSNVGRLLWKRQLSDILQSMWTQEWLAYLIYSEWEEIKKKQLIVQSLKVLMLSLLKEICENTFLRKSKSIYALSYTQSILKQISSMPKNTEMIELRIRLILQIKQLRKAL